MTQTHSGLSPIEQRLIRRSFGKVSRQPIRFTHTFCNRLKTLNPDLQKQLTPSQNRLFRQSLLESLALIVTSLDTLPKLEKHFHAIRQRSELFKVSDTDYDHIGTAIIQSLAHCLGSNYTQQTEKAWLALHTMLLTFIASSN